MRSTFPVEVLGDCVHDLIAKTTTTRSPKDIVVHHVVHEKLNFRMVCARRVPKMLTEDYKRTHAGISIEHLNRARDDGNFIEHLITGDQHGFVVLLQTRLDDPEASRITSIKQ